MNYIEGWFYWENNDKNKVGIFKIKCDKIWPERANDFACFRDKGPAARMVLKGEIWLHILREYIKVIVNINKFHATGPTYNFEQNKWKT